LGIDIYRSKKKKPTRLRNSANIHTHITFQCSNIISISVQINQIGYCQFTMPPTILASGFKYKMPET